MRLSRDTVVLQGLPPSSLNWNQRNLLISPTSTCYSPMVVTTTTSSSTAPSCGTFTTGRHQHNHVNNNNLYPYTDDQPSARVSASYQHGTSTFPRRFQVSPYLGTVHDGNRQLVYKKPIGIENQHMHQTINAYLQTANLPLLQPSLIQYGHMSVYTFWSLQDSGRRLTHIHVELTNDADSIGKKVRIIQFKHISDPDFSAKVLHFTMTSSRMTFPMEHPDEYVFYVVIIENTNVGDQPCYQESCTNTTSCSIDTQSSPIYYTNELKDTNGNIAFPRNNRLQTWGPPVWPFLY